MKGSRIVLERAVFDALLESLRRRGHTLIGPAVRGGAILWSEVSSAGDFPAGWTDHQEGGRYRLGQRDDTALFGYTAGPDSLKKYFLPPSLPVFSSRRKKNGMEFSDGFSPQPPSLPAYAFIGVRACDLAALSILDRVLANGAYTDPYYAAIRSKSFIVAVNCTKAGNTCFCASMGTGPRCRSGFDISMTEIAGTGRHYFVCEAGTEAGERVLSDLRAREASAAEAKDADALMGEAASHMGRAVDTSGVKELLHKNFEHLRWGETAARCLSCANCTMVCPTCFCTTVSDRAELSGGGASRRRRWDSCFAVDYSYIHGGSLRQSVKSRYRQWLTHKLGTWQDQFGTSGCVGCGRCITWCPVGIDITEEIAAIRANVPSPPRDH